jgi:hypothetical protein
VTNIGYGRREGERERHEKMVQFVEPRVLRAIYIVRLGSVIAQRPITVIRNDVREISGNGPKFDCSNTTS